MLRSAIDLKKNLIWQVGNKKEKNFLMKYIDNVPYSDNEIDYLYLEKVCKEYSITLNSKIPCNSGIMAVVFKGKIEKWLDTL